MSRSTHRFAAECIAGLLVSHGPRDLRLPGGPAQPGSAARAQVQHLDLEEPGALVGTVGGPGHPIAPARGDGVVRLHGDTGGPVELVHVHWPPRVLLGRKEHQVAGNGDKVDIVAASAGGIGANSSGRSARNLAGLCTALATWVE